MYSSHRVIFFLLYRQEYFCTNNSVRAGNDVIDIPISGEYGKYATRVPDVVLCEICEWSIWH